MMKISPNKNIINMIDFIYKSEKYRYKPECQCRFFAIFWRAFMLV